MPKRPYSKRKLLLAGMLSLMTVLPALAAAEPDGPVPPAATPSTENTLLVQSLYRQFFDRPGDAGGVEYWGTELDNAVVTPTQLTEEFYNADEYYPVAAAAAGLYVAALGEIPSTAEMDRWVSSLRRGGRRTEMAMALMATPEFEARFGTNTSNADYVAALYQLVLGREFDQGGLDYWAGILDGGATRAFVLVEFAASAEFSAATEAAVNVALAYYGVLGRTPTAAEVEDNIDTPVTALLDTLLAQAPGGPRLTGFAVLPAATFSEGPTSGTALGTGSINGQDVPFIDKQPVQGFSAILDNGDGTFLAMSDNGFGSLENSADYLLRVYIIRPDFMTADGGVGSITVEGFIQLSDPDGHIPFAITNHFTTERLLTGADFDIESIQRAPDGSLWIGDEFGPFLLHTDSTGILLEAPIPLPDFDNPGQAIRAPQNPFNEEGNATRIMNAVRTHAELNGNTRTPVFSPWHEMLKFEGSESDSFGRGAETPEGLPEAPADVFELSSVQGAGYPVVTWTVNDKERMLELMAQGVEGIISDRTDLLLEAVQEFDADGDGVPGDYLTEDGLIDIDRFDAQGHRGSRDLRPENTLPAMEVALDDLMTTLETDTGVSLDDVMMLGHEPYVGHTQCRRADGVPYTTENEVLIKDLTAAEIQATFICDNLFRGDSQTNDPSLSPVSVAFAADQQLPDLYVMPTLQQVFDFVDFYVDYYQNGPGSSDPDAERRWRNAAQVRYNLETKRNPRTDMDGNGNVYVERTVDTNEFADTLAGEIIANGLEERADIQSFDFSTLLRVQEEFPAIRTVYLFGDFPLEAGSDGTNLQDENGANTPWLAGLFWPYRETRLSNPVRAQSSGGFEGMALTADGNSLLPLLEKPLADVDARELLIHEFDLASKAYTGVRYRYPLDPRGTAIGDFIMVDDSTGLVIERDGTQGDLFGYKTVHTITLQGDGEMVGKKLLVNLLSIANPDDLGMVLSQEGDVGLDEGIFAFPFVTIEDIVVLGDNQIGVLNDNNFPFSIGRHVGAGLPDDNEFIVIDLPKALTE